MMDVMWILAAFLPLLTEALNTEKGLYLGTFELFVSLQLLRLLATFKEQMKVRGHGAVTITLYYCSMTQYSQWKEHHANGSGGKSSTHMQKKRLSPIRLEATFDKISDTDVL